ncbi:hypothetical protein BDD12DRAFT_634692, partial [Trichophaea hybrida]
TNTTTNTRNPAYSYRDIVEIRDWNSFNYANLMHHYGPHLFTATTLTNEPPTVPQTASSEPGVTSALEAVVFPQLRRTLRHITYPADDHVRIQAGAGDLAEVINNFKPDRAAIEVTTTTPDTGIDTDAPSVHKNRCPGDIKCSWKFHSTFRNHSDRHRRTEYRQVLSQLNFYMRQHGVRYGYIITDQELVCVRRPGRQGLLEVSRGFGWDAYDLHHVWNENDGELNLLLALVYLHLLVADERRYQ